MLCIYLCLNWLGVSNSKDNLWILYHGEDRICEIKSDRSECLQVQYKTYLAVRVTSTNQPCTACRAKKKRAGLISGLTPFTVHDMIIYLLYISELSCKLPLRSESTIPANIFKKIEKKKDKSKQTNKTTLPLSLAFLASFFTILS